MWKNNAFLNSLKTKGAGYQRYFSCTALTAYGVVLVSLILTGENLIYNNETETAYQHVKAQSARELMKTAIEVENSTQFNFKFEDVINEIEEESEIQKWIHKEAEQLFAEQKQKLEEENAKEEEKQKKIEEQKETLKTSSKTTKQEEKKGTKKESTTKEKPAKKQTEVKKKESSNSTSSKTNQKKAAKEKAVETVAVNINKIGNYSKEEIAILQRIVEAEATGEDITGKMMVANVVLNRVADDEFPDTIEDVVFQRDDGTYQFSPIKDKRYWSVSITEETKEAVNRVLGGEDYSNGALYFMCRSQANPNNVRWFDNNLTKVTSYGVHEFFK